MYMYMHKDESTKTQEVQTDKKKYTREKYKHQTGNGYSVKT